MILEEKIIYLFDFFYELTVEQREKIKSNLEWMTQEQKLKTAWVLYDTYEKTINDMKLLKWKLTVC